MSDTTLVDESEDLADESLETEENADGDGAEGQDEGDAKEGDADEEEGLDADAGNKPEKPVSRSERRIRALAKERDDARAERDRERVRAEDADRRANERRQSEDAAAERQRVELMSDSERFDYLLNKKTSELDRKIAMSDFRAADAADRSEFRAECLRNPALAKIRDEVEEQIAINRRAGGNAARLDIADLLLGRRARQAAPAAGAKQRKKAADDKQRQQGKPGGGRSDVSSSRAKGDTPEARKARLENIIL